MAYPTCAKCGKTDFELEEVEPAGSSVKLYFVQCAECGAPAGVTDYEDASDVARALFAEQD